MADQFVRAFTHAVRARQHALGEQRGQAEAEHLIARAAVLHAHLRKLSRLLNLDGTELGGPIIIDRACPYDIWQDRENRLTFVTTEIADGFIAAVELHPTEGSDVAMDRAWFIDKCADCSVPIAVPVGLEHGLDQWCDARLVHRHLPSVGCGEPF